MYYYSDMECKFKKYDPVFSGVGLFDLSHKFAFHAYLHPKVQGFFIIRGPVDKTGDERANQRKLKREIDSSFFICGRADLVSGLGWV